ncbi:MAG TPA: potassium transporter TrkG [Brumimicrobium sp.]|nr:potassium transporter TrkG [Brumimicrobium sp.]
MWSNFREKVNLSIYNSKDVVSSIFRVSHIIVALSMIGVLIYYYGFPQTTESKQFLTQLIEFSFIFYIIRFIVKVIYNFNLIKFFREEWLEAIVVLILIVELTFYHFSSSTTLFNYFLSFGFQDLTDFSNIVIQVFFFTYVVIDLLKKRDFKQYFKVYPGLLFMLSILIIVVVGTGLLMLPEMTKSDYSISFIDAVFISTSSASVTGLTTVDISEILTFKGQMVLMFLIQLGGLNTIAFGALYLLLAKFGIGLKQHDVLEDFVNESSFLETEKMFSKIIKWTLAIEFIGFLLIFILIEPVGQLKTVSSRIFYSAFHAVSSFCNAGMSTIKDGLMNDIVATNYALHGVLLCLFFIGGFGMVYLFDIFGIKHLRNRMKNPWKTLRFDTRITLYTTLFLLALGALVFFIFEHDRSLEGMSSMGKAVTTFFSAMTPRSAGLSTVDFSRLSMPVLVFILFLMFVGASSGSSGGGIRVSTFAVLLSSVVSAIKRKPHVEILKRTIDTEVVLKAYSVLIFFLVGNLLGIFALLITEQSAIEAGRFGLMDIMFEHVSAASTVGLSTGVTQYLSTGGKVVLIIAMFVGRVGTLTIAYLFGRQAIYAKYKYPKGHIMIG